ncbi:hypothetical protein FRC07_008613 [Ceratobasidium sp. 392]|nr:hypothetical protein FRC07_008613 [Ceratobasidium sp. 392]
MVFASVAGLALLASPGSAQWALSQGGSTGVAAMQMSVATATNVVIIDKFEQNPLHDSNDKPVWGAVYSVISNTARALHITTNSFCATGTWLSNGTLINAGGNPLVASSNASASNGLMGIRHFNPCADGGNCDVYESPYDADLDTKRIRLTSYRWYPSSVRLSDGSALIFGGANGGGWTNFDPLNNPSYEFYPPKNINGYNGM